MTAEVPTPEPLDITTDDGLHLEAQVCAPADARAVVVLSHPHPLYGGDMHNPLIDWLFRALPRAGVAAIRYNFRGAGRSEGSHGEGVAERADAAAAFAAGLGLGVTGPCVSVGWSFGADVSLSTPADDLAAWVGIAAPLRILDPEEMPVATDERPTLLLVPEHDQFRTPASAAEISESWPNTEVVTIAGGDHFLGGHADVVAERVITFVDALSG